MVRALMVSLLWHGLLAFGVMLGWDHYQRGVFKVQADPVFVSAYSASSQQLGGARIPKRSKGREEARDKLKQPVQSQLQNLGSQDKTLAGGPPEQEAVVLSPQLLFQQGNRLPGYPKEAQERGWEGLVRLALTIGNDGKVIEARVMESSGFAVLDRSALLASQQWRFELDPSIKRVIAPVYFSLDPDT